MSVLPESPTYFRTQIAQSFLETPQGSLVENVKSKWPILNNEQVIQIVRTLDTEIGLLEPLAATLSDGSVTDIVINGPNQVFIDGPGGLQEIESPWESEVELRSFAQSLVQACDRRLDVLNPFVDLQLPNGIRAHIVIPPISHQGTHISLRIPQRKTSSLADLLAYQAPEVISCLQAVVNSKQSFIVCGATGSGKTTLLRALLNQINHDERLVVIEDVQELNLEHPHAVSLQGRLANSENAGEVTMRNLVRQSLRMRPDRIVVGEIRGPEIIDLFTALNTGHQGSAATVHANSASDVISRLNMLGLLAGMSTQAIHAQIASALKFVIEVARVDQKRVVTEIGALQFNESDRSEYRRLATCWPEYVEDDNFNLIEFANSN